MHFVLNLPPLSFHTLLTTELGHGCCEHSFVVFVSSFAKWTVPTTSLLLSRCETVRETRGASSTFDTSAFVGRTMRAFEATARTSCGLPKSFRRTSRKTCRSALSDQERRQAVTPAGSVEVGRRHARKSDAHAKVDVEGCVEMATLLAFVVTPPALAFSETQSDFVTNTAGLAFTLGVAFLLFRLLRKRGTDAVQKKVRSSDTSSSGEELPVDEEYVLPDPFQTFVGALQAGGIALAMWYLTTNVDGYLSGRPLPSGYTARNISVTIKTIVVGLCYLGTFVFGANSVGLFGLTLQVLLQPNKVMEDEMESRREMRRRRKKRKELELLDRELKAAEALLQRTGEKEKVKTAGSAPKQVGTASSTTSRDGKGFLNLSRLASMDDLALDLDLRPKEDPSADEDD